MADPTPSDLAAPASPPAPHVAPAPEISFSVMINMAKTRTAPAVAMLETWLCKVYARDEVRMSGDPWNMLDLAVCERLNWAHVEMCCGWLMLLLGLLGPECIGRLAQYRPLRRQAIWTHLDALLGYPQLNMGSHPGQPRASYCAKSRADFLRGSMLRTVEKKTCRTLCINCGKHVTPYPASWARYDTRLSCVWCQQCYAPLMISAHQLKEQFGLQEPLVAPAPPPAGIGAAPIVFEAVHGTGRCTPGNTYYLYAQIRFVFGHQRMRAAADERLVVQKAAIAAGRRGRKRSAEPEEDPAAKRAASPAAGSPEDDGAPLALFLQQQQQQQAPASLPHNHTVPIPIELL